MKKIPTVFERDWTGDRSRVTPTVHPSCEWVLAGEGQATRKIDGMAAMIRDGKLYKRRELRKDDVAPSDFEEVDRDLETEKRVGWVPVTDGPEDRYFREAFSVINVARDGTYELIGPKVQGNPEGVKEHQLVSHASPFLEMLGDEPPRTYEPLRDWLASKNIEGIVFHHPDGRMAKIKLRDFGLKRAKP